ncbi:TonB-dependent receptor plug domain-containing protein [Phenylobacterium montanum]|uniref:TonB-dependent receptor n=1 Tax=Phenylobacterium montanum TaxID=2823693 RepID=A0A975FXF3_9CAUL|nr:TonB-dependent receptor [Caulobacter sp. S6]QUD87070.1 TonB-dependent receptor [Caulobacter sp. S6]
MDWRSGAAASILAVVVAPAPALATTAAAPIITDAEAKTPSRGVTSYNADFFAAARPATAYDMILRLPGFTFDGGAQVRGFADGAGNVLIDGERPTSKQDDLEQALKRIPATQVDHIDIIRGGAPGIDMQGRTLVANIVRKTGSGAAVGAVTLQDKVLVEGSGALPAIRIEWSKRLDDHSLEIGLFSGRFVDDGLGSGPHSLRDGAGNLLDAYHLSAKGRDQQSSLTVAYQGPLAGGKFKINGQVSLETYLDHEVDAAYFPGPSADDTYKDANDTLKSELGLHYERNFGPKLTWEALAIQQLSRSHEHAFYNAFDGQPGHDDEVYSISNVTAESIARSTLRYRPTPTLTIEGALEAAYNTLGSETSYVVNLSPVQLPAANEHVSEKRGDEALSATWSPNAHYTLETGIRLEESTVAATGGVTASKTLFYAKPRAVFTWSPDPKDQIRIRGEREVGQLDFAAFSASGSLNAGGVHAGNPQALPQQSWVSEIALERRFWGGGDATVTLRHLDIKAAVDRIVGLDPNSGEQFDEGGNLPRGRENDLIVDVTVPLDRLAIKHGQFKATATWRDAEVTDPTTHLVRAQTQVHPLEAEAHFTQDIPSWRASWGLDFLYGWKETYYRFDEVDLLHYAPRLTAFIEYKPTDRLSMRAEAGNLFSGGFVRTFALYATDRALTPTPYEFDYRRMQFGPILSLKVRRAFG